METIYLEHSAISRDEEWSAIAAKMGPGARYRLVCSEWNLYEIASDGDRVRAVRRAEAIDRLRPLWMVGRLHIQKEELRDFLWQRCFNASVSSSVSAIVPTVSSMLAYDLQSKVPLGWTAKDYVLALHRQPEALTVVHKARRATKEALITLQAATRKTKRAAEPEIARQWLSQKLPLRHPEGRPLTAEDRLALLEACLTDMAGLYASCRAIAVEHELTRIRSLDPSRRPEDQDATDFQHAVVGLAYCDNFVTRDGYLRSCAEEAAKALSMHRVAKIWSSIGALP